MPYGFENLPPEELDWLIRTVYGEAANEDTTGQRAVAAVIGNRMRQGTYGGNTVRDVVLAPSQFEPWGNASARARMVGLRSGSPEYQAIQNAVLTMQDDPTGGATHFYAPIAQAALGRPTPKWALGQLGTDIGNHRFYSLGGGGAGSGGGGGATPRPIAYTPPGSTSPKMMPDLPDTPSAPGAPVVPPLPPTPPVGLRGNDPKVMPAAGGGPALPMPIGTNIPGGPQMVPVPVAAPSLADDMLASLADSGGADLSGIGSGKTAVGAGGGAAWAADSGYDEMLGQLSKESLGAPPAFDNLPLGKIDPKLAPQFAVQKRIGQSKSQDLKELLANL